MTAKVYMAPDRRTATPQPVTENQHRLAPAPRGRPGKAGAKPDVSTHSMAPGLAAAHVEPHTKPPLDYSIAFQLRGRFFITCHAHDDPPTFITEIKTYVDNIPLATGAGPTKEQSIGTAIFNLATSRRNDLTNKHLLSQLTRPDYILHPKQPAARNLATPPQVPTK